MKRAAGLTEILDDTATKLRSYGAMAALEGQLLPFALDSLEVFDNAVVAEAVFPADWALEWLPQHLPQTEAALQKWLCLWLCR